VAPLKREWRTIKAVPRDKTVVVEMSEAAGQAMECFQDLVVVLQ
jgi:hypothetical protein